MKITLSPHPSGVDDFMLNLDVVPRQGEHVIVDTPIRSPLAENNGRYEVLQVKHLVTVMATFGVSATILIVRKVP